ncbi:maleylpyruvate isomerase family mycothiol-dependent enzyme [Ornithinimicrobium faecis]|uniref:maleylpyruvate isomerase family mycothiol-dependent enzyme n=1 Tax=Ornithinimicrobium faecis TaxID=2934158 RepID=UPI0021187D4B|nr:maleylpyruvate isomerase family mycothiol-dependent enzyme [Ornithinimicrobium sp. HY1745]
MESPQVWLESVRASTSRLVGTLQSLSEGDLREDSALPSWSRAHVAGHVARNADALLNLVTWARTGEMQAMYPSGDARHAGITATARLNHNELCQDLIQASTRLDRQMRQLTSEQWNRPIQWRHERSLGTAVGIPFMRWVEVEIHHTDLAAGYTFADWPADFVQTMLVRVVAEREVKGTSSAATLLAPDGSTVLMQGGGLSVEGPPWLLLAWLTGRADIPEAPELPPWR